MSACSAATLRLRRRVMNLTRFALRACRSIAPNLYHPPANVLLPYAHLVTDVVPAHIKHLYTAPSIAKFKADIAFLCSNFQPLAIGDMEELLSQRQARSSPWRFILSFDDGLREVYDVIAPILIAEGIPAIFFVNSATIDNRQLMWRHKVSLLIDRIQRQPQRIPPEIQLRSGETLAEALRAIRCSADCALDDLARFLEIDFDEYVAREKPYLTSSQMLELAQAGFSFGAHSHSHPNFGELPLEGQRDEIDRSVSFIRSLGLPCAYFAFPFNDIAVPLAVFEHLAQQRLVLSFGTSEARVDSVAFSFQRFALDARYGVLETLKELSVKSLARRLSGTEIILRH